MGATTLEDIPYKRYNLIYAEIFVCSGIQILKIPLDMKNVIFFGQVLLTLYLTDFIQTYTSAIFYTYL